MLIRIGPLDICYSRFESCALFGVWPMTMDYGDGPHRVGFSINVGSRVLLFGWRPAMTRVEGKAWSGLADQMDWP